MKGIKNFLDKLIEHHTILYEGKIYLLGNRYEEETKERFSELYELDLTAQALKWKKIECTDLVPKPRSLACMVEDNGKIYLFGGQDPTSSSNQYLDLYEYDIASKIWREVKIQTDLSIYHYKVTGTVYNGTLFVTAKFYDKKDSGQYRTAKVKVFDKQEAIAEENEKIYKLQMKDVKISPQSFDVHFKVQDEYYSVHKAVLSARCNFFKNMFESGMLESKSSEITIQDVEPSSFEAVLDFIYSNKVELTVDLACDLLKLTDKWSFIPLKNECEVFLSQQLTQANLRKIAAITDQVEVPNLENTIIKFVVETAKATKQTKSFIGLPQELYLKIIASILRLEHH